MLLCSKSFFDLVKRFFFYQHNHSTFFSLLLENVYLNALIFILIEVYLAVNRLKLRQYLCYSIYLCLFFLAGNIIASAYSALGYLLCCALFLLKFTVKHIGLIIKLQWLNARKFPKQYIAAAENKVSPHIKYISNFTYVIRNSEM